MTGFNTYFSLLKVNVYIPYQKVIVHVNHFGLNTETASLICSLCLCVVVIPDNTGSTPLPYMTTLLRIDNTAQRPFCGTPVYP